MAITQGEAEAWLKRANGSAESHQLDDGGWTATARLGDVSATGEAPDEPEARYVAITRLRKIIGKTNPSSLW